MTRIINASPKFGKSLTEQEINDFLTSSKLNIHLGTIDVYIETFNVSKKIDNLRKNNNLYFCIDDPNPPYKGIKGRGICRIHYDINHNIQIADTKVNAFVNNGDSVIIEINPMCFSTWDYRESS